MKRRDFLNISAKLSAAPFLLNSIPIGILKGANTYNNFGLCDRVLVLIQMRGGNDGLNTIIPLDNYGVYSDLRPDIAIPQSSVVALSNSTDGMHPSLGGSFYELYEEGLVNIVHGTGYDQHSRSHFKSEDIYLTGGDATTSDGEGWMGKFLKEEFSYLSAAGQQVIGGQQVYMQDPLGLHLGNIKPSLGFHVNGPFSPAVSLAKQDLAGYYSTMSGLGFDMPTGVCPSHYSDQLNYLNGIQNSVKTYASRISDVFNAGKNLISYPNSYLANQLKTVAKLLNGGSKTRVFLVDMSGFDHHANQGGVIGKHANLLQQFGEGVKSFQEDLTAMGYHEKVLTVTFSEFGRTPIQNSGMGTDHGSLAPMFVIGNAVNGGVTGSNLDIQPGSNSVGDLQNDYRQVFTDVLRDWMGVSDSALLVAGFPQFIQDQTQGADGADAKLINELYVPQLNEDCEIDNTTTHPSSIWNNGNPNEFSIVFPIPGSASCPPGSTDPDCLNPDVVTEITDCEIVKLTHETHIPFGTNVRIFPSNCETPVAVRIAGNQEELEPVKEDPKQEFIRFVEEKEIKEETLDYFEAFPNPFQTRITVTFKPLPGEEQKIQTQIVDVNGKIIVVPVVYSYKNSDYYSLVFDGSNLTAGVYFAVFQSEKRKKTVKLVKQ